MTRRADRRRPRVVLLGAALLLAAGAPGAAALPPPGGPAWVGSWATAVAAPGTPGAPARGFEAVTLRQVVHLSVGGDRLRVRLTNVHGSRPLRVDATTVAPGAGGARTAGPVVPVTFGGSPTVVLAPGTELASDPVDLRVADDSDLVVSTWLPVATGPATQRGTAWATSWSAPGDATADLGPAYGRLDTAWYFLDGIDVHTRSAGAVVLLGDSITEGCCARSSVDTNTRWSDLLADRLLQGDDAQEMGVLNAGISGNRLLVDGAGQRAPARFDRDVLSQTGVRTVVLLEGINDIRAVRGASAEQVVAVYRGLIARARAAGLEVHLGTLTPYGGGWGWSPSRERVRQAVNRWIRTTRSVDGVVDVDRALRDPRRPSRLLPAYDPGDHLHPDREGRAAMARAVDVAALR